MQTLDKWTLRGGPEPAFRFAIQPQTNPTVAIRHLVDAPANPSQVEIEPRGRHGELSQFSANKLLTIASRFSLMITRLGYMLSILANAPFGGFVAAKETSQRS